jgi:hypothetical protein
LNWHTPLLELAHPSPPPWDITSSGSLWPPGSQGFGLN